MKKPSFLLISTLLGCVAVILLLTAGQSRASAGMPPPAIGEPHWGLDIQVNPTPTGSPYQPMQLNFSLAINPTNHNNVIAGWDSYQSAPSSVAYGSTTDQGLTWSGGRFDGPWNPGGMVPVGNVSVGFDAHGTGYYVGQAQGSNLVGYFVLTTTNGTAWSTPIPVVSSDFNTAYNWGHMTVDPRATGQYAGSLYMFWLFTDVNVPNYYLGVRERYSRDGGRTWSADVQVSSPENNRIYYPYGVVASDGTVYVAFEELDNYDVTLPPKLYLVRSTDGGQTWGDNQLITGAPIQYMGRPDWKGFERTLIGRADCIALMRINHYPMIAVSPSDPNTVYVVWNDGRWQSPTNLCGVPGRNSDIAFSRTTDAGLTWSAPIRLNDDPMDNHVDHFQPDIAVRPDGLVGVTWLDRRYDPNHFFYDLEYSQSTDGGLTWSANVRVSDTSSDPDQLQDVKTIDNVGYRRGMVFSPDYVLPSWISSIPGTLKGDFYTDRGLFDTATPTSTSIATSTATFTPTPTPTSTTSTGPSRTPTRTATSGSSNTPTLTRTVGPTITPGGPTATDTPVVTPEPTDTPISDATPTACPIQFTDVPVGSTFYSYIRCLACMGLVNGYSDGTFRPNNNVTRGQLSKIVSNSAGWTDPHTEQSFQDVAVGSTFYDFIERLASRGYINGYDCGGPGEPCIGPGNLPYFRSGNNATRGQISKIVSNSAGFSEPPGAQIFEDVPPGSAFYDFINRLANRSIMSGYSCGNPEPCVPPNNRPYFRPNTNATRGQTSKIVANTFFPGCNPSAGMLVP